MDRIAWMDVARGIGIVLVVYGHVGRGLTASGIANGPAWSAIDFAIYAFHMPLFFLLSGMNVPNARDKPGYFSRRAAAIARPYFAFSLAQGLLMLALAGVINGSFEAVQLLLIPIQPIPPFWFLYVLFLYVAATALWRPGPAMMSVALGMLWVAEWLRAGGVDVWILGYLLGFFVFYVAGALVPPGWARGARAPTAVGLAGALVLIVTVAVGLGPLALAENAQNSLIMLPAAAGGIVATIWLAQRVAGAPARVLAYLGRNALAIYVMHITATAGTRIVLARLGIESPALHVPLGLAAGVAAPLVGLWALQRLRLAAVVGLPQPDAERADRGRSVVRRAVRAAALRLARSIEPRRRAEQR